LVLGSGGERRRAPRTRRAAACLALPLALLGSG